MRAGEEVPIVTPRSLQQRQPGTSGGWRQHQEVIYLSPGTRQPWEAAALGKPLHPPAAPWSSASALAAVGPLLPSPWGLPQHRSSSIPRPAASPGTGSAGVTGVNAAAATWLRALILYSGLCVQLLIAFVLWVVSLAAQDSWRQREPALPRYC